ncbi:hypothetical protein [uncultured Pseudacidovorax sp.]|uniref:hypothetical protein n=1 Tax=uncultured Pseudacidovorax sp. TaxID=679313 RepID=UPI0025EC64F3|nr:hypothetical protein [uncultured Pseudacidovorax sp.]
MNVASYAAGRFREHRRGVGAQRRPRHRSTAAHGLPAALAHRDDHRGGIGIGIAAGRGIGTGRNIKRQAVHTLIDAAGASRSPTRKPHHDGGRA